MKRCVIATAVLLGGTLATAHAEYLRIMVNLGPRKNDGGGNGPGMGAIGGRMGMMGMAGQGGNKPGAAMMGMMGAGGQPPGGMMGMMGAGGRPPGGMMGMMGAGGQPPGGMMGMMGAGGRPPGGMMGMMGAGGRPPGGMMGMMGAGGQPPGGMMGMMGMGGIKFSGESSNVEDDVELTSVRAEIVVEVKRYRTGTEKIRIDTKWGTTTLVDNDMFELKRIHLPTVFEAYHKLDEYKKAQKTADDYRTLAGWALEHGILAEFKKNMEALAAANPTDPAAAAFVKVEAAIERPITKADQSDEWSNRLDKGGTQPYRVKKSDHYALLYSKLTQESDVTHRLALLEKNYRAFFGWFALNHKVLPVPDTRLVAVLVGRPEQFASLHKDFDLVPMAADGFYARRYNLAVFSAERLDDVYGALHKLTEAMWTRDGWSRSKLLRGIGQQKGKDVQEFREAQMKALVETAMEEESEINSVSFEGTRQLLAATGLLPRKVHVPQWLSFGLGSFFETPLGAYWQGTGAPSWRYLKKYKVWENFKELDKPDDALRSVVTDHYFHLAQEKKDDSYVLKGRTMSWALTYFLMKNHLDGVLRYCEELNNLPRDMEFDEKVLADCFARAFGLTDAAKPNETSPAKVRNLVFEWSDAMNRTQLADPEAVQEAIKEETARRRKKAGGTAKPAADQQPAAIGRQPPR